MGFQEFKKDLAQERSTAHQSDRVSNISQGDSDGEVTFSYQFDVEHDPVYIQILTRDVQAYPKSPEYLLLTSDENLVQLLQDLSEALTHIPAPIGKVIQLVSRRLTSWLDSSSAESLESLLAELSLHDETQDADSTDEDWLSQQDEDDDYELFGIDDPTQPKQNTPAHPHVITSRDRQRKDMARATEAGFSVGFWDPVVRQLGTITSLSVPVRQLNVSQDVLDTWGMTSADHLVLLVRTPHGYPEPDFYLEWGHTGSLIEFELGRCSVPKPSALSCRQAFLTRTVGGEDGEKLAQETSRGFSPLYLFNFITKRLGTDLTRLLTIRRQKSCSWLAAHESLYNLARDAKESTTPSSEGLDTSLQDNWLLKQDDALRPLEDLSIPLVGMQCVLQLVVHSGKYCVDCHREISKDLQTIRPFVCSNELCLEHYFSLDLGPGLEHEIINNPYVVDLLVCFFFGAVCCQKLRTIPKRLRLQVFKNVSEDSLQRRELQDLTCRIPSVLKMRDYLLGHPGRRLAQASKIVDQDAYRLLLWIVASNRSHIVQDQPVSKQPRTKEMDERDNRVTNMGSEWMQFRFAQGSPEKEHRFRQAVAQNSAGAACPTLFAWHGSHLGNWHGIVGSGLNFDRVDHGRASGNGVYLSHNFQTSRGYASTFNPPPPPNFRPPSPSTDTPGEPLNTYPGWPNSELRASTAISLCEVVNRPSQFVSTHPHYVVKDLDWIQCRLLFVNVNPSSRALKLDDPRPKIASRPNTGHVSQDPQRRLKGADNNAHVEIPRSALSGSWHQKGEDENPKKRRRHDSVDENEKQVITLDRLDLDGVLGAS